MFDRPLDPRKRDLSTGDDYLRGALPTTEPARFISLRDELQQTFYKSGAAPTYEEKLAHAKRFTQMGTEFLPDEESDFKDLVHRFMKDEIIPLSLHVTPTIDDKQPIYNINHNIGGGGSTKCHLHDFARETARLKEEKGEESYNKILPVFMEVAKKLKEYGLMPYSLPFGGGKVGDWAKEELRKEVASRKTRRGDVEKRDFRGGEGEDG